MKAVSGLADDIAQIQASGFHPKGESAVDAASTEAAPLKADNLN